VSEKASDRRGTWRGTFTVLYDDPDFQRLTPTARHVLLTLRYGPLNNALCIFPLHLDALARHTGLDRTQLDRALRELATRPSRRKPWLYRADGLVWIRNGLAFEPSVSRENPNHWPWVNRLVAGLPRSSLVRKFKKYYGLPWVSHPPSHGGTDGASHGGSDGGSTNPVTVPTPTPHTTPNLTAPPKLVSVRDGHTAPAPKGIFAEVLAGIRERHPELALPEAENQALAEVQRTAARP
jgi:hypothetical protein